MEQRSDGKLFKMKEENENISFNFYLQVFFARYNRNANRIYIKTTDPFSITFSSNFLSFDFFL